MPNKSRNFTVQEGISYAPAVLRSLTYDVARPNDTDHRRPFLLFIHGGGWNKGDKDVFRAELEHFASRGYPCASMQYRLSGEATFPAQWVDVRNALRHVQRSYPHVALVGHSAGGHLAALGALAPAPGEDEGTLDPVGVIGLSGVYDMRYRTMRELGFPFRACCQMLYYGPYENPDVQRRAELGSPIVHAESARQAMRRPPRFLLIHGEQDRGVPVALTQAMDAELRRCGFAVETILLADAGHYVHLEQRDVVLAAMERFVHDLGRDLGTPAAP